MIVEISWSRVASWILKISGRISALSGKDAKLAYLYFWGAFNISKSSQDLKIVPQLYFASNFIGFCKKKYNIYQINLIIKINLESPS